MVLDVIHLDVYGDYDEVTLECRVASGLQWVLKCIQSQEDADDEEDDEILDTFHISREEAQMVIAQQQNRLLQHMIDGLDHAAGMLGKEEESHDS